MLKKQNQFLSTALAVRGATAEKGVTNVNEMVPIVDFFQSQILPELQTSQHSILRADALKFVFTFRQQVIFLIKKKNSLYI